MREQFDRWLVRHPRDQHRRTGNEVPGTKSTIFKTYWFKWPDADTFKARFIELLACYPDGVIADEDEESCDAIWEAVTGVIHEQKSLSRRMIPPSVVAAFDAARQQRITRPGYHKSDSWHWGRVDGYACFVNNFPVDGVPSSVTVWSRDRLRQGHHYEGYIDAMTAIRVDVIARIAATVNPALERAIAGIIAHAGPATSCLGPHDAPREKDVENSSQERSNDICSLRNPLPSVEGGPAWIPSPVMARCLSDFGGWNVDKWKKKLSDPPAWMSGETLFRRGVRGKRASSWQPVLLIDAIIQRRSDRSTNVDSARRKFANNATLKPWLDAWDDHSALMYPSN